MKKNWFLVLGCLLVAPALAGSQGDRGPPLDTNAVGAHAFTDMKLARVHGHWLVKEIRVGKVEKL